VTEDEVPGYYEVIKKPMDFGSMRQKVRDGAYGHGQKAIAGLYSDFLLVFDNCALFNKKGEEVWNEAARVFGLLPEAYAAACFHATVAAKRRS
jgi:hypothetical protein